MEYHFKVSHLAHIDEEVKMQHVDQLIPLLQVTNNRALASPCFPEMKAEQNAWSPMGMPGIIKLGQLDPLIAGGNELYHYGRLKISHFGMFMMRPREGL